MSDFVNRHVGPSASQIETMCSALKVGSASELADLVIPRNVRTSTPLNLSRGLDENEALDNAASIFSKNQIRKSWLGMGYANCHVPSVIKRNVLENPGWYTQYTPYQSEISQGRLEALFHFQTLVAELTGLEVSGASLLDEATAVVESMILANSVKNRDQSRAFFVAHDCHPQTIEVVSGRAEAMGIDLIIANPETFQFDVSIFGAVVQYPNTFGGVHNYKKFFQAVKDNGGLCIAACDLLSLTLLEEPASFGADIAVGNAQRLGIPLGFGGPHPAFFAAKSEFKRQLPGRVVGLSKDKHGRPALRLALQTREQHIRRERATSNICTAQALLASMVGLYSVYMGPDRLRDIASTLHTQALQLAATLRAHGCSVSSNFFDTLHVTSSQSHQEVVKRCEQYGMNIRKIDERSYVVALDETAQESDLLNLVDVLADRKLSKLEPAESSQGFDRKYARTSSFLTQKAFRKYQTETEFMRYLKRLENKDLSLVHSMIPLGSCTMKLNSATELTPLSWSEVGDMHPFAPEGQHVGYTDVLNELADQLSEITGLPGVSLQPNSGAQGELTGLLTIQALFQSRGETHRNICLIPASAHGTNPASAALSGMKPVVVACKSDGEIDLVDLKQKIEKHAGNVSAFMATYPSTHGFFDADVRTAFDLVHEAGGRIYLDGANLNAQVGLCRPGEYGVDVCHINLHKTFCIPHGGGGPGAGPICVSQELEPFLPAHRSKGISGEKNIRAVSAAPWGNASILPISWMYIKMMGGKGLTQASTVALLSANYIAKRLDPHFPVLFRNKKGFVAHECIIDLRPFKDSVGVTVEDVAKRLMDYNFHAPTVSFPINGTLMIEPTECETLQEIDRFCDAMESIRAEIASIESGKLGQEDNPLKNAPHAHYDIDLDPWPHAYSRKQAFFPLPWVKENKFWVQVSRVENALGDRNLVCCGSIESEEG